MVRPTEEFWRRPTSRASLARWLLFLVVAKISRWAELSPKGFMLHYAAQSPGVKNIFFNWSKLQQLEVDTSPTRQQRKAPLYSLSQLFPVRRLARFDNKSKISIPGEFILHKVVEISPKAPFLHKRSRVGPRVRTSTDFERELAEDRRCDGRKHSKE